jgi:hypothetical protein
MRRSRSALVTAFWQHRRVPTGLLCRLPDADADPLSGAVAVWQAANIARDRPRLRSGSNG